MELDDLKHIWHSQESSRVREEATRALIDDTTHKNYKSKMKKIRYPEIGGSIVCIAAAIFISYQLGKLETVFQQGAGIIAIILLFLLSLISLASLKPLAVTGNVTQPHAEALKAFAEQKLKFYRLQKANVTLSCLLLVTIVILLPAFFGSGALTNNKYFWLFSFTIGYLFLLFFSTLVSRYYKTTIRQMDELLKEIDGSKI